MFFGSIDVDIIHSVQIRIQLIRNTSELIHYQIGTKAELACTFVKKIKFIKVFRIKLILERHFYALSKVLNMSYFCCLLLFVESLVDSKRRLSFRRSFIMEVISVRLPTAITLDQ